MLLQHLLAALNAESMLTRPKFECHVISNLCRRQLDHISVADGTVISDFFFAFIVDFRLFPDQNVHLACTDLVLNIRYLLLECNLCNALSSV